MTDNPSNITGAEVRKQFIEFFEEHAHTFVPSSSLVPKDDPTLLFTNSGMVQFKNVFLGTETRAYTRAANSQKCMRVAGKHNDLDDVGRDDTHHTFFEMLGNWSFGDYYKEHAIRMAWQLLTEQWGLPKDRLYATVFKDEEKGQLPQDDEAAAIWFEQPGFHKDQLLYLGRKDNFWEMADRGPCGPCSEIHFDLGPDFGELTYLDDGRVDLDGPRFVELWNLVFMQYNRTGENDFEPLPATHVDTGMGLERIVSVLQGVYSNYRTDLFTPMMDKIQELAGHTDAQREENLTPYRVIADHVRGAAFLIGDGVIPGATGQSYVCRMIIRRASRFAAKIGLDKPFMAEVAAVTVAEYGDHYTQLANNRALILKAFTAEEERFLKTLDSATAQLDGIIKGMQAKGETELNGAVAFDLYSTYGLPVEITRDMLEEHSLTVDEEGFHNANEAHALASGKGKALGVIDTDRQSTFNNLLNALTAAGTLSTDGVAYDPYEGLDIETSIVGLLKDGTVVDNVATGNTVEVVLAATPFYVASGGQMSDVGTIRGDGWEIRVDDTQKPVNGLVVHIGEVVAGSPTTGASAEAYVAVERRWDLMRNHTATHLLHAELQSVLGDHVRQAGSLVAPDRLRFDFTHNSSVTAAELQDIAERVNANILKNYPVDIAHKTQDEAIADGATALFGEKYGDIVRTVKIGGENAFSYELCGGTHVPDTADIGAFIITSESSAAAGIRRVEAITGRSAQAHIQTQLGILSGAASSLNTSTDQLQSKIDDLLAERDALKKAVAEAEKANAMGQLDSIFTQTEKIGGVSVLVARVDVPDAGVLPDLTDKFRQTEGSGVIVLGTVVKDRPNLIAVVTKDLIGKVKAGDVIKTIAKTVGGGGGGKPTMARAGGKDASKLDEALAQAKEMISGLLVG